MRPRPSGTCLLLGCALVGATQLASPVAGMIGVEAVPDPAPPSKLAINTADGLASLEDLIREIRELDEPLGEHYPVFMWGAPTVKGQSMAEVETVLQARGLCVPPNIGYAQEEALDQIAQVLRFRRERGWVSAVLCQGWGQVSFSHERAPGHQPPAIQDPKGYPCVGVYRELLEKARARAVASLEPLVERDVAPDLFLMDWEVWNRCIWRTEPEKFAHVWDQVILCPRCRENLPAEYLESPEALLRGLELIRSEIMREAFVEPVKTQFPEAKIGNYFTTSHVRNDQPMDECYRVVGWYRSGLDFSQPVAYGRYWAYHNSREFVGWNVFWKYLGEVTWAAQHQVGDEFQIPWVARLLEYQETEPFDARGRPRYAWPRESYREYLRHAMLRGARSFCIFKPNVDRRGNRHMYLTELQDVLGVFREMRRFGDTLDNGHPMNLANLPGEPYSTESAVVWSGVSAEDRAVVRAVSFTGADASVNIEAFGDSVALEAPTSGRTYVLASRGQ